MHRLLAMPAVIFNRKDGLQDAFLAQHFQLTAPQYPRHFVPAVDAFESALAHGLGWGMVPEGSLAGRAQGLVVSVIASAGWARKKTSQPGHGQVLDGDVVVHAVFRPLAAHA